MAKTNGFHVSSKRVTAHPLANNNNNSIKDV